MGDEIADLKHNLKVSFSRMKEDIVHNQEKIDKLIEINEKLQEQIKGLEEKIGKLESKPAPLKSELMRSFKRNKKQIIKQRILALIKEREIPLPELKEIIVDEKGYCSKATFYRYVEEMKKEELLNTVTINDNRVEVVGKQP